MENAAPPSDDADLERLARLARCVLHDRRLPHPDITMTRRSKICGSEVVLDLGVERGLITRIGYKVRACSLGQAATAVFSDKALGKDAAHLAAAADAIRSFLSSKTEDLPADWLDLNVLRVARAWPRRHGAALLPFEAALAGLAALGSAHESS